MMGQGLRLYLLRHGETESNRKKCYNGWGVSPLTATGCRQNARQVAALAEVKLAAVYSSDRERCLQLARALATPRQLDVQIRAELRELNFGLFENKKYNEVLEKYPEELCRWLKDPVHYAPPGGETLQQLIDRASALLDNIPYQIQSGDRVSDLDEMVSVAVVTHGGVVQALLCHWLGTPLQRYWQYKIEPGSITVVEKYEAGAILCQLNNLP